MDQANFDRLVNETVEHIKALLIVKGGEYAGSDDRLANFKRGADLVGVTPLQCALIYMSKHYDAVGTYIRDAAAGRDRPRSEGIEGRLDDLINYCILIKGLVREAHASRMALRPEHSDIMVRYEDGAQEFVSKSDEERIFSVMQAGQKNLYYGRTVAAVSVDNGVTWTKLA